ncbi:MAG: radical SAM protein [Planctomycetes bacterium]|nr:radical SAM protein [Planctomycetota bacterium]
MKKCRLPSPKPPAKDGGLFRPLPNSVWEDLLKHPPRRPDYFSPERIILTAGSTDTPERATFVERIVRLYPRVPVEYHLDTPHNKVPPVAADPYARHVAGKKILVFGIHKSAVRYADEKGNTCPNYWHFSPYGFCPYDCQYCYLAGTRSVFLSPSVKIFVNLPEIWQEIDHVASRLATPTAFYLGKLQDALALEPLTGYVRALVPRFAEHPLARMTLLTKAAEVDDLLGVNHSGRTILSWSMNPPEIHARFERSVPSPDARLEAMRRCADAGYPVRVNLMPVVPVPGWREMYRNFLHRLLDSVPISRLTMGGICIYPDARTLMERKLGSENGISETLAPATSRRDDRRQRFAPALRVAAYRFLVEVATTRSPETQLALCLETPEVMNAVGLRENCGHCNCVV